MLESLQFVQGTVAKGSTLKNLEFCRIAGGVIMTSNSEMVSYSPIDCDIEATPQFEGFSNAVSNCGDDVQMAMTGAGKLSIKSGGFKCYLPCVEAGDLAPFFVQPSGDMMPDVDGAALLEALRKVRPFVGTDDTRKWSRGVNLGSESVIVTNNVILVEHYTGTPFPFPVVLPASAVDELLRIGKNPVGLQGDQQSLTFHYEGGRWMRTQLIAESWPDVAHLFQDVSQCAPLPAGFFDTLEKLRPFAGKENNCFIRGGAVSTDDRPELGASFRVAGLDESVDNIFALSLLLSLSDVCEKAMLGSYPSMPFTDSAGTLRGMIACKIRSAQTRAEEPSKE